MQKLITYFPVYHGGRKPVMHPRLGVEIAGQTAIAYLRFRQKVKIGRLELPVSICGRWVPSVPTHPAHLILSVYNRQSLRWDTLREVDLPRNPAISGRGLKPGMDMARMDAHFAKAGQAKPHVIELDGLVTDCLRVECDREHPVWPNHGECNGGEYGVPFAILKPLRVYGETPRQALPNPPYRPILRRGRIKPAAPKGMRLEHLPHAVFFKGRQLSVGFSLVRPLLLHLGWDRHGEGRAETNRLLANRVIYGASGTAGLSGPLLRTMDADTGDRQWTGTVEVAGNRVCYRKLHAGGNMTVEAAFTVLPDEIRLELSQHCIRPQPALEAEAWRLVWDMAAGMTGSVSMPTQRPGRNGDVEWPLLFAGDGNGGLLCELIRGDPAGICLQTESYHDGKCRSAGFTLAPFPAAGQPIVLPKGTRRATVRFRLADLAPASRAALTPGVKRHWSSAFSAFRPELGGFSNNAVSVNCHVNQGVVADMAVFTKRPKGGPDPLRLARFTLERALLDGAGYGYHRSLYLDSDPILLSGIGRLQQLAPDRVWLTRIAPGVVETTDRILGTIGQEGLAICRALSGNSRSFRWSSNAMDVVGYGHMDAYVNAWTYRALKNAVALLRELGDAGRAVQCREAAQRLRQAYPEYLLNPETGWIAGWRSRDGRLHDYAFLWVNGPALAFGLLSPAASRKALEGLERLREKSGPPSAYCGLPGNLLPIHPDDHMLPRLTIPTMPTFETYTDGSLMACGMGYYLRALRIHGLDRRARTLALMLDRGFAGGAFCGPYGSGREFHTWDGLDSGYEGTFGPSFGMLYAMAVETGALQPPKPEWWPEA